jgi:hypothetical protein
MQRKERVPNFSLLFFSLFSFAAKVRHSLRGECKEKEKRESLTSLFEKKSNHVV